MHVTVPEDDDVDVAGVNVVASVESVVVVASVVVASVVDVDGVRVVAVVVSVVVASVVEALIVAAGVVVVANALTEIDDEGTDSALTAITPAPSASVASCAHTIPCCCMDEKLAATHAATSMSVFILESARIVGRSLIIQSVESIPHWKGRGEQNAENGEYTNSYTEWFLAGLFCGRLQRRGWFAFFPFSFPLRWLLAFAKVNSLSCA